jgi:hypothetical protein
VKLDNFVTVRTGEEVPQDLPRAITTYVREEYQTYSQAREAKEAVWLECWASYLGTPESTDYIRGQMIRSVGNTETNWRHKINVGKAYENIETINAYLQSAFFPNRDWMDVVPQMPGYADTAKMVKKYLVGKLETCKFKTHWDMFIRQLLVCGTSVLALPWRLETRKWKKRIKRKHVALGTTGEAEKVQFQEVEEERIIKNAPEFETLDLFDCYLDPFATDPHEAGFIRRVLRSRAELIADLRAKVYHNGNATALDVVKCKQYDKSVKTASETRKDSLQHFQGIKVQPYQMTDQVELLEYWGDVHLDGITFRDVVVTVMGDKLLRFETNPYWCGKPFVIGTCIPVVRSPYALGAIEPSLGLLHELNIITNQRLDNLEVSSDSMFTLRADDILQPEDVYTKPGKVFVVSDHNSLQPLSMPQNFTITYEESGVLESRIDKNTGTGAFIGVGQGRGGERVTAQEIQAVRDAGGNRLSGIHKHIEQTALLPCLDKVMRLVQEFTTQDEVVRVSGKVPGSFEYYQIGPEELCNEYYLAPVGADHVADKEEALNKRMAFLDIIGRFPDQFATHVNFYELLTQVARYFGFDDYETFIQENYNQQQQQPEEMPVDPAQMQAMLEGVGNAPTLPDGSPMEEVPTDPMEKAAYDMGGFAGVDAMRGQMSADGGQSLFSQLAQLQPSVAALPPTEPETEMELA